MLKAILVLLSACKHQHINKEMASSSVTQGKDTSVTTQHLLQLYPPRLVDDQGIPPLTGKIEVEIPELPFLEGKSC